MPLPLLLAEIADYADEATLVANLIFIADLVIRVGLSVRVVMRRHSVGVSLSWLTLILLIPFVGAGIYLILGENRLGSRRAQATVQLHNAFAGWRSELREQRPQPDWEALPVDAQPIHRQATRVSGMPALPGNQLDLYDDSHDALEAMARDIDAAQNRVHLEFYIWADGGDVDLIADALIRAAERGVTCRILVDAVGSKTFLRRSPKLKAMRSAGVQIVASLPAGLFRAIFRRLDLRNHRKLLIVDDHIGYTGSLNMIDPNTFKQDAGVGKWIDAMVRVQGPAVEALGMTFLEDWQLETQEDLGQLGRGSGAVVPSDEDTTGVMKPGASVQAVPSGPSLNPESIHRLLIGAIYAARESITLTTPYFVPDEALLIALTSAAARGVDTLIILPKENDSFLVRHASNAYLGDLLQAGVKVAQYRDGLLHTKSVTIDSHLAAFGTVNLDMRSFYLNFELTLFIYDTNFSRKLTSLQQSYLMNCNMASLDDWKNRPLRTRLLDNTARLLGPLL
ncbi:cardiolipin synthase [Algisphaera agarilytica]|uniref:Cardiolipin synthase n=1 Tax=Algisphaera agarilytica TaxID=1385975 RepID=A0A7X0H4Z7_9BACT|nr:cardiolipin synthase [Algisphaera agarilytica]MBB6429349.1 cardiolipin synthase [Algisphaera agarilytica]